MQLISIIEKAVSHHREHGHFIVIYQGNIKKFQTLVSAFIWSDFPRHLTKAQYHDPYKAIKKFCKYMAESEWNNYLKDVTEFALSKNTIEEVTHPYNILTVRMRMMQLIEACHLLDIRTNKKKKKAK